MKHMCESHLVQGVLYASNPTQHYAVIFAQDPCTNNHTLDIHGTWLENQEYIKPLAINMGSNNNFQ